MTHRMQQRLWRYLGYFVLVIILIIVLFPIYWIFLTAVKPETLTYSPKPALWTNEPTLDNVRDLFARFPFLRWMLNSVRVAVTSTVVAVGVGTLAAYSLSRLRYPGRQVLSGLFFTVYLVPASLLFVPLFVLMNEYQLLDNLWGLSWTYMTFTIPFCTWMLKAYFSSIPRELEDAALVDGASRLTALVRIILPVASPGIASASIFAFTLSWNEFLFAFIFIRDNDKLTLGPGLTNLLFGDIFLWGQMMSAAVLMSLPVIILYFVAQRYVVSGLTAGSVKG